ncbi:MAG: sensor histidine kinase, partial [Hyphomonadaceae bacterium]
GHQVRVEIGPGPQVIFADDGCGIGTRQQGQLFEKFTLSRGGLRKGSGLGLSICQSAMTRMGGSITVASDPGLDGARPGTKFIMKFQAANSAFPITETGLQKF